MDQFAALELLYRDWNRKINVISRKDIANFGTHHLLHSLAIGLVIRFSPGTTILDAGTGGGLPGIPLAILFPEASFTLVDSIGKKIRVVCEIGKAVGLTNIDPVNARVESIRGRFEFVTGRAVSDFNRFVRLTRKRISGENNNNLANGILYLGGGSIEPGILDGFPGTTITPLSRFYDEPYFESKKLIYLPVL